VCPGANKGRNGLTPKPSERTFGIQIFFEDRSIRSKAGGVGVADFSILGLAVPTAGNSPCFGKLTPCFVFARSAAQCNVGSPRKLGFLLTFTLLRHISVEDGQVLCTSQQGSEHRPYHLFFAGILHPSLKKMHYFFQASNMPSSPPEVGPSKTSRPGSTSPRARVYLGVDSLVLKNTPPSLLITQM